MLVKLEERYKKFYTINDLERARAIIKQEREDESTCAQYAEYAANEILKGGRDFLRQILKATARTAKNCRAWNAYDSDSEDMDIWIDAIAETSYGFIKWGTIWQSLRQK